MLGQELARAFKEFLARDDTREAMHGVVHEEIMQPLLTYARSSRALQAVGAILVLQTVAILALVIVHIVTFSRRQC